MTNQISDRPVKEAESSVKEAESDKIDSHHSDPHANKAVSGAKEAESDKIDSHISDPHTKKALSSVKQGKSKKIDSHHSDPPGENRLACVKEEDPDQIDSHHSDPPVKKRWAFAPEAEAEADPDQIETLGIPTLSLASETKSEEKHRQNSKKNTSEEEHIETLAEKLWSILLPGTLTDDKGDDCAATCRKVMKEGRKALQAFHSTKSLTATELITKAREIEALTEAVDATTLDLQEPRLAAQTIYSAIDQADRCLTKYIDGLRQGDIERLTDRCQNDAKFRKKMEKWLLDIEVKELLKESEKENAKDLKERLAVMKKALKRRKQGTQEPCYYRTSGWGTDEKMVVVLKRTLKGSRGKLGWVRDAAGKPSQLLRKSRSGLLA